MADEAKTVEVSTPETPATESKPTREDARAAGWSQAEMDSAEKRGMFSDSETPEAKAKREADDKAAADQKVKDEADAKAKADAEAAKKDKEHPKSGLPDFSLTPDEEKVFLDTFKPGSTPRGLYFRMKNERQARQTLEAKNRELETRLAALEAAKKEPPKELPKDENGDVIDPENQPLTLKMLKELNKKENEEFQKRQAEQNQQAARVADAQKAQEEYAREIYPDFDDTVKKAMEVAQNLDTLIPEKWKQAKAVQLLHQLQLAAAQADKLGLDDYNAALIGYELGQLHPEWKPAGTVPNADKDGKKADDPKGNGNLTPEQVKRAEENNRRKGSSASVPGGGGRRTVSVEDVTAEDLNRMTAQERVAFRNKHPERYLKLVRG